MPCCQKGHRYEIPQDPASQCARPVVLGEQDFRPASRWTRSPNGRPVYPFTADEPQPLIDDEPCSPRKLPPGRLLKQGRLRSMGGYVYVYREHRQPVELLYLQGRKLGWEPPKPEPPDPAPDEELVRQSRPTLWGSMGKKKKSSRKNNSLGSEESDDSDGTRQWSGLHTSKVALNLSVHDLGADFKRQKILERLKLLEAEKQKEDEEEGKKIIIKFADSDGTKTGEDMSDTSVRSCSTCKDSLDALVCSKPKNRRRSMARWREKDKEAYEYAVTQLTSFTSRTPSPSYQSISSSQKMQETIPLNKRPPSENPGPLGWEANDLPPAPMATDERSALRHSEDSNESDMAEVVLLTKSMESLSLKIASSDFDSKLRNVIRERLEILNSVQGDDLMELVDQEEKQHKIRFASEEIFETDEGMELRHCSSCESYHAPRRL